MTPSTVESREPARPTSILGTFPLATSSAIGVQIAAATSAFHGWAADAPGRARAMHAWAAAIEEQSSQLLDIGSREVGKPVREMRAELDRAIAIVRYYAQAAYGPIAEVYPSANAATELSVFRRPHGVVSVLAPWNFPIAIPIWKIAPALAYGNTVLFRPSSEALATASLLTLTAAKVLPDGVLQLVIGDHQTSSALVDDRRVRAVTFTGSTRVGMDIVRRAASRGVPVQAEMGGHNAAIVLADADLEFAANTIAHGAMDYAGQKCTATRRVVVVRDVARDFVPRLAQAVDQMALGMPEDEATDVGPVISSAARGSILSAVAGARRRGARKLTSRQEDDSEGWFIAPQLLAIDDPKDDFAQIETFGPVASVLVVDTDEQALAVANATDFGLVGSVFTRDLERGRSLASQLDVGLQRVNAPTTGTDFYVPFGGEKASSYGPREQGTAAREFFTHTRTLLVHSGR